jgi:hypothetical protein
MFRQLGFITAVFALVVAAPGAVALDFPLYGILSDGGTVIPTSQDVKTVASVFWMTQGSFNVNPGVLRQANASFRPIRYVPTWATNDMRAVETSPLRSDTLGYKAGLLASGISSTATSIVISLADTRFTAPTFPASAATSGDISTSCSDFVSWIRLDSELIKVTAVSAVDNATKAYSVSVIRGFSNTAPASHSAGAVVLAPAYNSNMPPASAACAARGGGAAIDYQVNPVGLGRTSVTMLVNQTIESVLQLNYSGVWFDCWAASAFQAVTGSGERLSTSDTPGDPNSLWDVSASPPVQFTPQMYHKGEAQRLAAVQEAVKPTLGTANKDYFIYANNLQANKYTDSGGGDARFLMQDQVVPAWPGNDTLVSYEPLAGYSNEAYGLYEVGDCHFAVVYHQDLGTIISNMLMLSNLSYQGLASMPMVAQAGCKSPALERISFDGRDLYEQFSYGVYLLAVSRSLAAGETTSFGLPVLYWRNTTAPNGTVTTTKFAHVHERYSYGLGEPEWPTAPVTNASQWQLWPASHGQLLGRRFSNGLVILNPAEASPAMGVALNETLLDPDNGWAPTNSVDVVNGTAKILLRSKP